MISPDNNRLSFLHRWKIEDGGIYARLYTANIDGSELHLLSDSGRMSHFCWRNENEILAWGGLQNSINLLRKYKNVVKYSKKLKPSKRGELEITDLLNMYRKKKKLSADFIGRGGAWLDTGTMDDYYKTISFVSAIENRQGLKIACLEEISLNKKWIKKNNIINAIKFYGNCDYSKYLLKLI